MKVHIRILIALLLIFTGYSIAYGNVGLDSEKWKKYLEERPIWGDLCKQAISFVIDSNEAASEECVRLADSLLKLPEPSVKGYFCAASALHLCNKSQRAIEILELAVEKYPKENAPIGTVKPAKIIGRFWIAGIAMQIGDTQRAKETYETILKEIEKTEYEGKVNDLNICRLYLAEIELNNLKRKDMALERLKTVKIDKKQFKKPEEIYDIYKDWAEFQQLKISKGKSEAARLLKEGYPGITSAIPGFAAGLMQSTMMLGEPLSNYASERPNELNDFLKKRNIESPHSSITRDLARLGYGFDYEYRKNYSKAEELYSSVFQDDSFFSPAAGVSLARVKKAQNKNEEANMALDQVSKKFPGYGSVVRQVRQSWKK